MQVAKLRARFGSVEVDFEGDEAFLKTEVSNLLSGIADAVSRLPNVVPLSSPQRDDSAGDNGPATGRFDQSTNTIASLISAKTGPDLAVAAAAYLCLVKGRDKFPRRELLDEMQGATTYYNQNYSGNLSKILSNLVRGKRLNLVGTQTYALTKSERDAMEARLAQSG